MLILIVFSENLASELPNTKDATANGTALSIRAPGSKNQRERNASRKNASVVATRANSRLRTNISSLMPKIKKNSNPKRPARKMRRTKHISTSGVSAIPDVSHKPETQVRAITIAKKPKRLYGQF